MPEKIRSTVICKYLKKLIYSLEAKLTSVIFFILRFFNNNYSVAHLYSTEWEDKLGRKLEEAVIANIGIYLKGQKIRRHNLVKTASP
jgi:hypothetical protein